MAPRWRAAWWPKMSRGGARSGSEHGPTLASSVVALDADHPHGGRGGDRRRVGTVEVDSELASTGPPPRTHPFFATTLLASVERCSRPARPPRTHPFFATTLLASVERCSRPARLPEPIPSSPPRCSPAWSDVQDQRVPPEPIPSSPPRCSPAWSDVQDQRVPPNPSLLRHHAARQRGAMFKTRP